VSKILGWMAFGQIVGTSVFFLLFRCASHDDGIIFVLSLVGGTSVAAIGSALAAVTIIQDEIREMRREMNRWQSSFQLTEEADGPSTQFKQGLPPKKG
jgi:hypothetical protein